jgi:hypothetical protein
MSDPGIIHGFQERRQMEEAIAALGRTASEAELISQARALADRFPAERLAPAVQRHLGDANSQLRGGLGHLCALLPTELIAPLLREVAGNRQKTPIERMSALLILERYLGESVSPALTNDLAGNDDIAMQSLLEAIEEGRSNRHVLLEYVTQMQEHGVDVAYMVMGLLNKAPIADQVEVLRLIAQDQRTQVARAALDHLAALAAAENDGRALRALHTLAYALPPALADYTQRSLRKLQFTGRRHQPPADDDWRTLLSPADAGGYFHLWLMRSPSAPDRADGVLIGLTLGLQQGIMQCSGVESMEASQLPPPHAVGDLVPVEEEGALQGAMLEAPFAVGRWLLAEVTNTHWQQPDVADLPSEYKLYNDLIWQFPAPTLPEAYQFIFAKTVNSGLEQPDMQTLSEAADGLVAHPAMRAWVQWAASVWTMLAPAKVVAVLDQARTLVDYILREIDALPQRTQFLESMASALRVQALWFAIHGADDNARRAMLLAHWMRSVPMRQNPLLAGLLAAGLVKQQAN